MNAFLLVSAGGFLGANLRYGISVYCAGRYGTDFPVGTLVANLAGSFLAGLVLGLLTGWFNDDPQTRLLLATGLLGAETTFSTYTYETMALLRAGLIRRATFNFLGGTGLGLAATSLGLLAAYALTDTL